MRNLITIFLLCLFVFLSRTVYADIYLEIIVDGSGSMWEKVDGSYKIVTVRDAVIEFLRTRPDSVHVGIRDFGSKVDGVKRDDCKNTRLLQPIQTNNTQELINSVSSISPVGSSPVAYAISQALLDFEANTENKLIILIADGGDSCNRKACQWINNEVKTPGTIPVYVIGFNPSKTWETKQLECFASSFGGTFTNVNSGSAIVTLIHEILKKITAEETAKLKQIEDEKLRQEEEKLKLKEIEQSTRLSIEITNDLSPLIADAVVVDTLIINGKPVEFDAQKRLANKESQIIFDQIISKGKHSLTISYKKIKRNHSVQSRPETLDISVAEGKTTHIHFLTKAGLFHYGLQTKAE
jgi:hypothetical protein